MLLAAPDNPRSDAEGRTDTEHGDLGHLGGACVLAVRDLAHRHDPSTVLCAGPSTDGGTAGTLTLRRSGETVAWTTCVDPDSGGITFRRRR